MKMYNRDAQQNMAGYRLGKTKIDTAQRRKGCAQARNKRLKELLAAKDI